MVSHEAFIQLFKPQSLQQQDYQLNHLIYLPFQLIRFAHLRCLVFRLFILEVQQLQDSCHKSLNGVLICIAVVARKFFECIAIQSDNLIACLNQLKSFLYVLISNTSSNCLNQLLEIPSHDRKEDVFHIQYYLPFLYNRIFDGLGLLLNKISKLLELRIYLRAFYFLRLCFHFLLHLGLHKELRTKQCFEKVIQAIFMFFQKFVCFFKVKI